MRNVVLLSLLICILSKSFEDEMVESILECLGMISQKDFDPGVVQVFINEENDHLFDERALLPQLFVTHITLSNDILYYFSNTLSWTMRTASNLFQPTELMGRQMVSENVILLLDDHNKHNQRLKNYFKRFIQNPFWNSLGKNLIVVQEEKPKAQERLSKMILNVIWSLTRAVDVVIMIVTTEKTFYFYTWFPYKERECDDVLEVALLDVWSDGKFRGNKSLFPLKISKQFNGCNLYVSTDYCSPYVFEPTSEEYAGFEVSLIRAIASVYNFTIHYVYVPDNEKFRITALENGTVNGAFKLLSKRQADIVFSCLMITYQRYLLADILPMYFEDYLIWCVPRPDNIPYWLLVFKVFEYSMWLLIWAAFIFSSVTVYLISAFRAKEHNIFKSFLPCFFMVCAIDVNNSSYTPPKTFFLRCFIFLFAVYAMHITSMYQTALLMRLMNPGLQKIYSNPEEAVDYGLVVYLLKTIETLYNNSDFQLWNKIYRPGGSKFIYDWSGFDDIAYKKTAMCLMPRAITRNVINFNDLLDDEGKPLILCFDHRYATYPVTMYMPLGHPLQHLFREKVYGVIEGGLLSKWLQPFIGHEFQNSYESYMKHNKKNSREELNLCHLEGAFYVLLFGLILSSLSFMFEVLYQRYFLKKETNDVCEVRAVCRKSLRVIVLSKVLKKAK